MRLPLDISAEVREALARGRAVVALESTVIAHGLPAPENLETARAMEAEIRSAGAVPATVAVFSGRLRIGLGADELARLAAAESVGKVARRDLAAVLARAGDGATTVSATMAAAHAAGIPIMATGGIGGVHRATGGPPDISGDLVELSRTPVAVVCSGAKSFLNLAATLEALETLGVPVVGYRTGRFPAFHARESALPVPARVGSADEAARLIALQAALGGGTVLANPVPADAAVDPADLARWTGQAVRAAVEAAISGAAATPFILSRMAELSGGRTVAANRALLVANARLAGEVAVALARSGRARRT